MWIKLPDLDRYWTNEVLSMMASSAGQPIAIDTSSSDEARVYIEVDVNEPLVTGVHVDDGEEDSGRVSATRFRGCASTVEELATRENIVRPHPRRRNMQTYGSHNLAPRREHGLRPFAGGGGLLRDAQGSFIAAFATPLDTSNSLMAEIGALEGGLRLALKLNVERILIEGDSKITTEMLNGKRKPQGRREVPYDSYQ
ncbi:hypothetical protein AAG906_040705 [Vitis piasezkii]